MAVIEPKLTRRGGRLVTAAVGITILCALPAWADRAAEMRTQLSYIATALTDGNAADAMGPFDKSFPKFDKLRRYFEGLTDAYQLVNEVDVIDEQDTDNESRLTVDWTLTMSDFAGNYTEHRTAELNVRLVRDGKKWKIVDFSPIDMFNPQQR